MLAAEVPMTSTAHHGYGAGDDLQQPLSVAFLPLLGSLIFTGAAVLAICGLPRANSLTWAGVFGYAICYVLIAHSITMWAVCRGFRAQLDASAGPLIIGLWMAVAWLPLLWILVQEHSAWVAAVPPLIAGHGVVFLRRWLGTAELPDEPETRSLFAMREEPSLLSVVAAPALSALAFQAGIVLVILDQPFTAGLLMAAGAVYPVWRFPMRMKVSTGARRRSVAIGSFDVLLLTSIALIPFLRSVVLMGGLGGLLPHVAASGAAPAMKGAVEKPAASDYSGIILFVPAKPKEKLVPPPPMQHTALLGAHAKPLVIPFDGAYWYFKVPDPRPKPDARVVKGDPIKANVHSTDFRPLAMEAHQMLGSPIRMDCCTSMRVSIRNGDNRIGAIHVELILKEKGRSQSLGTEVLRSSVATQIPLDRAPVDETLSFPIPASVKAKKFDEIAVVIKAARERSRAGAKLAVQEFTLVP
jgi:hypothetical protein